MPVGTATLPDRYSDPRLVARGGMGAVYCARDTVLGRLVAIKVLDERYAEDETVRKRFTREALAAARLSSEESIVTIFDVGESDGQPFIVMEYLPGGSLHDVLKRNGAQSPARALDWLEQAARALDQAHGKGVVHRDVKPANLLLDREGRVHVADFGVASAAGLDSLTQAGTVIGTAGYLAPEQAEGREATAASDRYGLAVVAFELLAGSRPYENDSPTAEATAHVRSPVPSVAGRRPGLPAEADAVFLRALAKNPADRYSTGAELVAALRAAFADSAGTTQITPSTRATRVAAPPPTTRAVAAPARAPRRPSWLLPLALLALLCGGGGALAAVLLTRGDDGSPAPAQRNVRVTVTEQGRTVEQTVTVAAAAPPTTTPSTAAGSTVGSASGSSTALQGYRKMQAGDYSGALPLLEQAANALRGTGLAEAYNDYNLAFTLAKSQGCSVRVIRLLDASQAIQGHRTPIDQLRKACG